MLTMLIYWMKCTYNKEKEYLLVASNDIGLDVNAQKTKYTFIPYQQNVGHHHNMKIGNKSFERVAKFKTWEQT
jgi:hypothetical protein